MKIWFKDGIHIEWKARGYHYHFLIATRLFKSPE